MGFKPSELKLPYNEFKRISQQRLLDEDTQDWLNEWNRYDLAISPIDDDTRKVLRYGHHKGWFACKNRDKEQEFMRRAFT